MSLKNSNDTIGNRTRDLPVCSVVQLQSYIIKNYDKSSSLLGTVCCMEEVKIQEVIKEQTFTIKPANLLIFVITYKRYSRFFVLTLEIKSCLKIG
jgi:hypothetical protein